MPHQGMQTNNEQVTLKHFAPFTDCISKIDDTRLIMLKIKLL